MRTINSESWKEKGSRVKVAAIKADLDEGTATVLEKLTGGVIRISGGSGSGALFVHVGGRLFASDSSRVPGFPPRWAFGARPAPESKN